AANHWGPVELDQSVNDLAPNDGRPITLNGQVYEKGLGVHAPSEIVYDLNGQGIRFISDIGVDDESGDHTAALVTFEVWGDGTKLYDSGPMNAVAATQTVDVDITGIDELKLIVTDGGNARANDHADWANAFIV